MPSSNNYSTTGAASASTQVNGVSTSNGIGTPLAGITPGQLIKPLGLPIAPTQPPPFRSGTSQSPSLSTASSQPAAIQPPALQQPTYSQPTVAQSPMFRPPSQSMGSQPTSKPFQPPIPQPPLFKPVQPVAAPGSQARSTQPQFSTTYNGVSGPPVRPPTFSSTTVSGNAPSLVNSSSTSPSPALFSNNLKPLNGNDSTSRPNSAGSYPVNSSATQSSNASVAFANSHFKPMPAQTGPILRPPTNSSSQPMSSIPSVLPSSSVHSAAVFSAPVRPYYSSAPPTSSPVPPTSKPVPMTSTNYPTYPAPPNASIPRPPLFGGANFNAPNISQQTPAFTRPPTGFSAPVSKPPPPPNIQQQQLIKQQQANQHAAQQQQQHQQFSHQQQQFSHQQQQQQQQFSQQQFSQQQFSNASGGYRSAVTQDGWNKAWGTDYVDLLQQRHILPPEKVHPPKPVLAQEFVKNCHHDILRSTFTKVPETKNLLQKAKIPFEEFQYDPVSQTYGDPSRRPEVREATIEYIAPSEYMLRPPQPAAYLWLLDTSRQAVDTGYLKIVCDTLLENIEGIPGDRRALIGFMTFSSTVQFYLMAEGSNSVNMLEVGDLDDIFVPHPDDLLVNIEEQRDQIIELLKTLPQTHADTTHTQSALGPALTAAFKLLSPLGGRITVLTCLLPSVGPGALKPREDPNQRASSDVLHLNPATDFYKKLALDCSGQQIAVDLFTLNSQYIDLATLSGISKFSGGCVNHFPNFHVHLNPPLVAPFVSCLTRYITRKIGFEAVMRIRATRGLAITNFHGHFFVRSPDLLSLPNINPDAGFAMQVCIEEPLHNIRTAAFQAALLYTSSRGERRIRVHTLCLPVTGNLPDVLHGADQQAAIALLARMAVDRCIGSTSTDARDALVNASVDVLTAYRNSLSQSPGRALVAPHNLKLWPLYTLALLKSVSFRTGLSTKLDDRVYNMCELKTLPTQALITAVYPDLYPIHSLSETGALSINEEVVPQPPRLQLSAEHLSMDGVYLADAGSRIVIYIRSGVSAEWLQQVMEVEHYGALPQIRHGLPELDTPTSRLLNTFIRYLNSKRPYSSPIVVLREDSAARQQFTQLLVEDRCEGAKSYVEFVQFLASSVK
ncbi:Sec23/Sec24 helical domain [Trinorchestia longiramus]|nr:Sec23/Sec24 helical domain [Trinorchestia longiramus]